MELYKFVAIYVTTQIIDAIYGGIISVIWMSKKNMFIICYNEEDS